MAANYLNQSNLQYLEQIYAQYQEHPSQVENSWRIFFEGMEFGQSKSGEAKFNKKELDVYRLIRAYRDYGHLKADLDPLKLTQQESQILDLSEYNLSEADYNTRFQAGIFIGLEDGTLKQILNTLESTYCKTLTVQVAECAPDVRMWFYEELEDRKGSLILSKAQKETIFKQLCRTESLEKFIHTRYVGAKRFSIEGGDSMIPMLCHLADYGTQLKLEELVIGMAHRGRLNVLANFLGKGLDHILSEFEGTGLDSEDYEGDVKYHLGYSTDRQTPNGNCHLSLAFNPSHLEFVAPVVQGMVRVKQRTRKDTKNREKVIPVLIHGEAAFSGQGVVTETLQLSQLEGYKVGGSIHIILNNQVGFTTSPKDSRSTLYSSDVAKSIKAPILLVNGDDVEACVKAMDVAMRFRQKFKQDIVIDLICYRRFGHNEGDEPMFTQPEMYKVIKKHPTTKSIYKAQLLSEAVLTEQLAEAFYQEKIDNLQKILDEVRTQPLEVKVHTLGGPWEGLRRGSKEDFAASFDGTQISQEKLQPVIATLTTVPENFNINSKVKRLINNRKKMIEENQIDWGLAELLCYGSLCVENTPVRLSGQDCKRGTFTHRHAVYVDQETGQELTPLAQLNPKKGEFCIYNSSLSEIAVLGFEYGNSSLILTF